MALFSCWRLAFYLLLAISLSDEGLRTRPNGWPGEKESDSGCIHHQYCAHDLASTTPGPAKRQLGSGFLLEDERPRPSPASESPPYANSTGTTSNIATHTGVANAHEVIRTTPFAYTKPWCFRIQDLRRCSTITADQRDAQPDLEPLTNPAGNERTTTATATKTDIVTMTSDYEMATTRISTTTATSHHEMTDTRTVTMTPYPSTTGLAAAASSPAPALLSTASSGVPIAAIAVPVALAALIALLLLPCCIRRFLPRVWSRLDRILPVEDGYSGVAAGWARMKLTRQRNRELRARAAASGPGAILTGDGRGSGRWSEKDDEGLEAGRGQLGMLGRWRQRQEEKLRVVDERRAREERWGLRPGPGVGSAGANARSFEDVRRDELRKAREERGAGNGVLGL